MKRGVGGGQWRARRTEARNKYINKIDTVCGKYYDTTISRTTRVKGQLSNTLLALLSSAELWNNRSVVRYLWTTYIATAKHCNPSVTLVVVCLFTIGIGPHVHRYIFFSPFCTFRSNSNHPLQQSKLRVSEQQVMGEEGRRHSDKLHFTMQLSLSKEKVGSQNCSSAAQWLVALTAWRGGK